MEKVYLPNPVTYGQKYKVENNTRDDQELIFNGEKGFRLHCILPQSRKAEFTASYCTIDYECVYFWILEKIQ